MILTWELQSCKYGYLFHIQIQKSSIQILTDHQISRIYRIEMNNKDGGRVVVMSSIFNATNLSSPFRFSVEHKATRAITPTSSWAGVLTTCELTMGLSWPTS